MKPSNIPSYKHRHLVKQLVKPLTGINNFGGYCLAIVTASGRHAWLSSTPRVTVNTVASGLARGELLLSYEFLQRNRVIFPDEFAQRDSVQKAIDNTLKQYEVYRSYCCTRFCSDCCLIIAFNTKQPDQDSLACYQHTIDQVETLTCRFLTQTMPIFLEQLPELAGSQFASDLPFREQLIKNRINLAQHITLSASEKRVLYWSAQGKSVQDIADITKLSKNTVDSYRRDLLQKLQAANITQAVYVASRLNLIA